MFEALTARLTPVIEHLRGRGLLNEGNISEALREVRRALLEADVGITVARSFIDNVKEKALGGQLTKGVNPGQQMVAIIHAELVALLGGNKSAGEIVSAGSGITRILLIGLQGSGKTTACAKLALRFKAFGRTPALLGLDPYRPAAGDQLKILAGKIEVPALTAVTAATLLKDGIGMCVELEKNGADTIIVDTAGRQTVDDDLMTELAVLKEKFAPAATLLVLDALTGQDAVATAEAFTAAIECTGAILSKLDGDSRGGAALSLRAVTGLPILYSGVGEELDRLELFHPDRMATRILGMGDVVTLVEKAAEKAGSEEVLLEEGRRFIEGEFTLDDLKDQLKRLHSIGPVQNIVDMLPGRISGAMAAGSVDESSLVAMDAIMDSMTLEERRRPSIIDGSRRRRIARGSGRTVQEVNNLLKQFEMMKKMAKTLRGQRKKRRS